MWSDSESKIDYLNYGDASKSVVDILTAPGMLPVSVGVFGEWGVGKSSLLNLIEIELANRCPEQHIVIRFDASLYRGLDDARAALLERVVRELHQAVQGSAMLGQKTAWLISHVDIFRTLETKAEPTELPVEEDMGTASDVKVPLVEQHADPFRRIRNTDRRKVEESAIPSREITPTQPITSFLDTLHEVACEMEKRVVVMIDNLDRHPPSDAIRTMETIRSFLFLPQTACVIAADEERMRGAFAAYFKGIFNRHQIDNFDSLIQQSVRVPKVGIREVRAYLFMLFAVDHGIAKESLGNLREGLELTLQQSWYEEPIEAETALAIVRAMDDASLVRAFGLADKIAPILATTPSIRGNPRIIKRLLNVVKMRTLMAQRHNIPLDRSIIAKLVIFEHCAGEDATVDLYRMIDTETGLSKVVGILERSYADDLPKNLPQSWTMNPTVADFVKKWKTLDPSLQRLDLRPAVYLSRETIPLGVKVVELSSHGQNALQALVGMKSLSSPEAKGALHSLPPDEHVLVMEEIISHLRMESSWDKQPQGFAGAYLLAKHSTLAAALLINFVNSMDQQPAWLAAMFKNQDWF